MNCELITNASCANIGSKSIALFFAGWGMDATPFRNMAIDCDMAVVWDYSNLEIDLSILREYQSIYLFAWSFGIFAATAFMHRNPQLPIVFKMAINGTQFPIDDRCGIPRNLFCATRDNLSERSLAKFHRRICGSQSKYAQWITMLPSRSLQSLHDELVAIDTAASSGNYPPVHWDKAIASKCDLIFPFENQMTGWEGLCDTIEIDETSAHFPDDLETLINGNIINKKLIKQRFANSLNGGTYDNNASIQQKIATTLHDLWKSTIGIKNDAEILEIGCGTGFLTRLYATSAYPAKLVLNDLCHVPTVTLNLNVTDYKKKKKDAEQLTFPAHSFDYIVSSSAIQWLENLPLFFNRIHRWLKHGGAIVISTFGSNNMKEIKESIKISLNYKGADWYYNEIKRNFDIVLINEQHETMLFDTPLDVLRHIQSTGVNSINNKKASSGTIKRLLMNYPQVGGKFPLTYNPIYIIAIKK